MNPLKVYGTIALVLILGAMVWAVVHWDNNRLKASYDRGVLAERTLWQAEVRKAKLAVQAKSNALTLASEDAADQARLDASKTTAASSAANQTTVEKITDAYEAEPLAPCRADAVPKRLPAGVLEGLGEARAAALGGTTAATSGLQPTQRGRPADAPPRR